MKKFRIVETVHYIYEVEADSEETAWGLTEEFLQRDNADEEQSGGWSVYEYEEDEL